MNVVEGLKWRYAVKEFDISRRVSEKDLSDLKEVLRLTASSFGLQPWKFLIVSSTEMKNRLLEHSWNQKQVIQCSHHIVFARPTSFGEEDVDRFLKSTCDARNSELSSLGGYRGMILGFLSRMSDAEKSSWMEKQVYIALGNFLTAAAMMGIDSCPMEGIVKEKYDEVLSLSEIGLTTVVACPIGYRSSDDKYSSLAKVRYGIKEVVIDR